MGNAILQRAQSTENKGINSETKIPGATGDHFLVKAFGLSCFSHNFMRGKMKLQTSHDLGVPWSKCIVYSTAGICEYFQNLVWHSLGFLPSLLSDSMGVIKQPALLRMLWDAMCSRDIKHYRRQWQLFKWLRRPGDSSTFRFGGWGGRQELLWSRVLPSVPTQDARTKQDAEITPFVHTQPT